MTSLEGGGDAKAISKSWLFKPLHQDTMDYDMDYVHRGFPKTLANPTLSSSGSTSVLQLHPSTVAGNLGPRKEQAGTGTAASKPVQTGQEATVWQYLRQYLTFRPRCELVQLECGEDSSVSREIKVDLNDDRSFTLVCDKRTAVPQGEIRNAECFVQEVPTSVVRLLGSETREIDEGRKHFWVRMTLFEDVGRTLSRLNSLPDLLTAVRIAYQLLQLLVKRKKLPAKGLVLTPSNLVWDSTNGVLKVLPHTAFFSRSNGQKQSELIDDCALFGGIFYSLLGAAKNDTFPLAQELLDGRKLDTKDFDLIVRTLQERGEEIWTELILRCLHDSRQQAITLAELPSSFLKLARTMIPNLSFPKPKERVNKLHALLQTRGYDYHTVIDTCYKDLINLAQTGDCIGPEIGVDVARLNQTLGCAYFQLQNYQKALLFHQNAVNIYRCLLGWTHPYLAVPLRFLGVTYSHYKITDEALKCCLKAARKLHPLQHDCPAFLAQLYADIAYLYAEQAEYGLAIKYAAQASFRSPQSAPEAKPADPYALPACASHKSPEDVRSTQIQAAPSTEKKQTLGLDSVKNLQEQAETAMQGGLYKSALESYQYLLLILKQHYGEVHDLIYTNYVNMGVTYEYMYNYERAIECFQKAEQIALSLPVNAALLRQVYIYLARVYETVNNVGKANEYIQKAGGNGHLDYDINYQQAENYISAKNYPKAIECLKETVANMEQGNCMNCLINAYEQLAHVYMHANKPKEELQYHIKAERCLASQPTKKTMIQQMKLCYTIGTLATDLNDFKLALEYLHSAEQLGEQLYGRDSPNVGQVYHSLATVYDLQGNTDKSTEYYEKRMTSGAPPCLCEHCKQPLVPVYGTSFGVPTAAKTGTKSFVQQQGSEMDWAVLQQLLADKEAYIAKYGETNETVGLMWNDIGVYYIQLGDYANGIKSYENAYRILAQSKGPTDMIVKTVYYNLAKTYEECADYQSAAHYWAQGIQVALQHPEQPEELIKGYTSYANTCMELGEFTKTIELCTQTLQAIAQVPSNPTTLLLKPLTLLQKVYIILDDHPKAIEYGLQLVQIGLTGPFMTGPFTVEAFMSLGTSYKALGHFDKAIESYTKANDIAIAYQGRNHLWANDISAALKDLYHDKGTGA